jgi:hypothetical protein
VVGVAALMPSILPSERAATTMIFLSILLFIYS